MGSSNGRFQPFGSREEICTLLRELHIDPGFVLPEPALGNRKLQASDVFGRAASSPQEGFVDFLDVNAAVLNGFDRVGDLDQLAGSLFRIRIGAFSGKFHQAVSRCAERTLNRSLRWLAT